MFRLEIETGNAAFEEDPKGELARILKRLGAILDNTSPFGSAESGRVFDINGNTVGTWQYTPEEES